MAGRFAGSKCDQYTAIHADVGHDTSVNSNAKRHLDTSVGTDRHSNIHDDNHGHKHNIPDNYAYADRHGNQDAYANVHADAFRHPNRNECSIPSSLPATSPEGAAPSPRRALGTASWCLYASLRPALSRA